MSIRNKLTQNLVRFFLLVALSSSLFSCTDSGCIEADDFGEYESQTITVTANASQDNCKYDASLALTDSSQGPGVKSCFTTGSITITDETGASLSSSSGCQGFTDSKFQKLCTDGCVQSCLSAVGSASSAGAEPSWNSTDAKGSGQNSGVTIMPGAEVMVRAVGNVSLGNSVAYPDIFVGANNPLPHSYNSSWQNSFFDARGGQSLSLYFSGSASLGSDAIGQGTTTSLYNLSRVLVLYAIDHPDGYAGFDSTQTTEKAGTKKVPLLPDPQAWKCSYTGSDQLESTCGNSSYVSLGYTNADDGLTNSAFPISSASKQTTLTKYGGIVRWGSDGLKSNNYDPFSAVSCNGVNGSCSNIQSVSTDDGRMIGDLSSAVTITNNNSSAVKVSLRSLTGDTGCDTTLNLTVRDPLQTAPNDVLYTFSSLSITSAAWTNSVISLEAGHQLVIGVSSTQYNLTGANCGRSIAVRFLKYHDLLMDQSGFVRFAVLGGGSGACTIKGRVINPNGSHTDFITASASTGTADFYEYGTYNDPAGDALNGLVVPVLANGTATSSWSPGITTGTTQVFMRKGQKIRFDPSSWNGTWTTSGGLTRQCGIGMAMMIDPRPALLCRGKTSDLMPNPNCVADVNGSGTLLGCQATAKECSDSTNSTYYCPYTSTCAETVVCTTNGDSSNNYTKTGCSFTGGGTTADQQNSDTCINSLYALSSSEQTTARSRCGQCSTKMLSNIQQAAKISVSNIFQCYDLESYSGKVDNIPLTPASLVDVNNFLSSTYAKGATRLNGFSGTYGNIPGYSDTGSISNGKSVYQSSSQYILGNNARLRSMVLDGSDFLTGPWSSYSDNTATSGTYNGNNGINVGFSGSLDYRNGEWMQVLLCKESSNSSYNCKSVSTPTDFASANGQPEVVKITAPTASTPVGSPPNLTGNYAFDVNGNLYRYTSGAAGGDCTLAVNRVQNSAGSLFYCHTYRYSEWQNDNSDSDVLKLRLSFKILDPELGNCAFTAAATNDGITLTNPFYDSSIASNTGASCSYDETPGNGSTANPGTCKKQFYCANRYSNNSGQYYVNVKVKSNSKDSISSIISAVVKPIIEVMDGKQDDPTTAADESTMGQAERVYKLLIADPRYKAILTMSLIVMITFWGVGYLLGVSDLNHAEIMSRIFRIAFIYLMVGETGWDWFNMFFVKFFKEGTDYISFMMASSFDDSPEITAAIDSGNLYDKSVLFTSVDRVFNLFFSSAVQKKISALLFASIFGWAYLLIIWWSFLHYVYAVSNAVLLYLTAQVFISIMFVVGPLFFVFLVFNQTKEMFDNWLKQLIGFSLQQIFLLITLAFFNMLMYEVLKMSLGYKVCWDEVWVMNLGITRISLMSFWTIASLPPRTNANSQVGNIGNPEGIPSIFSILFIWVIASLMEQFIGFMTDLASAISGGLKASDMGGGVRAALGNFHKSYIQPAMDRAHNNTVGRAMDYADDKLFDSGKTSDARRESEKKQLLSDISHKSAMSDAGTKAASKFRAENAGMGESERAKGAAAAAEKAMRAKAESMGLDSKQTERLMNDKGIRTGGTSNVFVGAYRAMKSGTNASSLKEQAAKSGGSLSTSEKNKALANASSADRAKLATDFNSGKISSSRTAMETAMDVVSGKKSVKDVAKSAAKSAGSAMNTAVSAAVSAATGQSVDLAQAASEAFGLDADFEEAKKQMAREGISSPEKIRERAAQNKAEKNIDLGSAPDEDGAIGTLREADHVAALEAIEQSDDNPALKYMKKMAQKASTAAKKINPNSSSREEYRKQAKSTAKSAAEVLTDRVDTAISEADTEKQKLESGRVDAMSVVKSSKAAMQPREQKIEGLRKKQSDLKEKANNASGEEKADLEKQAAMAGAELKYEERELQNSDEFKENQRATVAVHQIDAKINNQTERKLRLEAVKGGINSAKEAMAQAQDSVGKGGLAQRERSKDHQKLESSSDLTKKDKATLDKAGAIYDKMAQIVDSTDKGSKEHTEAVDAYREYNMAGSQQMFDRFVEKYGDRKTLQEQKVDAMQSQFDQLRTANDFADFAKANPVKK